MLETEMTMAQDPAPQDVEEGPKARMIHEGPMPRHIWESRGPPRWRLCGMHLEEDDFELVHRAARRMEGLRLFLQFNLVMGLTCLVVGLCFASYLHESFIRVPFRCWEDTFGPLSRIWEFEPPTFERSRFEEKGNLWHVFMFSSENWIGKSQDLGFLAWNWTVTSLWKGPWYLRPVALSILCLGSLPFCFVRAGPWEMRWCCEKYLMHMPEGFLILHQLKVAHEIFGRKLSPAAVAEMEAFMEWKDANL